MKLSTKDKFEILFTSLKLAQQDRRLSQEHFDRVYEIVWKIHETIIKEKYDNEAGIYVLKDIIIFLREEGLVSTGIIAKWFNVSYSSFYAIQSNF